MYITPVTQQTLDEDCEEWQQPVRNVGVIPVAQQVKQLSPVDLKEGRDDCHIRILLPLPEFEDVLGGLHVEPGL